MCSQVVPDEESRVIQQLNDWISFPKTDSKSAWESMLGRWNIPLGQKAKFQRWSLSFRDGSLLLREYYDHDFDLQAQLLLNPQKKKRLRHGFWWTNPLCFFSHLFFQVMVNWWFGFLLDPLMKGIDCYKGAPRFESQTSGPQTTPTRGDQKKHFDLWIEAFAKRILLQILGFCTLKSFKILFVSPRKLERFPFWLPFFKGLVQPLDICFFCLLGLEYFLPTWMA